MKSFQFIPVISEKNTECAFPFKYGDTWFFDCHLDEKRTWCTPDTVYSKTWSACKTVDTSHCTPGEFLSRYDLHRIFVSLVFCTWKTCGFLVNLAAEDPTTSNWAGQILKGIAKLTCPSNIPYSLKVYGNNTQVVLTANFDPRLVIMAAAEYQSGRVIVSASSEFGLSSGVSVSAFFHFMINQYQRKNILPLRSFKFVLCMCSSQVWLLTWKNGWLKVALMSQRIYLIKQSSKCLRKPQLLSSKEVMKSKLVVIIIMFLWFHTNGQNWYQYVPFEQVQWFFLSC